jgi:hypothetical protein
LVLKAITAKDELIDDLVHTPTLADVDRGYPPLPAVTGDPTRRFLADILMRNRDFIRDWKPPSKSSTRRYADSHRPASPKPPNSRGDTHLQDGS